MKTYKATVKVVFDCDEGEYEMSKLESPNNVCLLCQEVYDEVIGEEVVGEVTFILRKIKGRATDYVSPFRITAGKNSEYGELALEIHNGTKWYYAKYLNMLGHAIDAIELKKWAGRNMFSIEMEY